MAKKKQPAKAAAPVNDKVHLPGAGVLVQQPITETLETNYMPYAMSVIVSRAIPEIDGFKPSHRKILYTMYKIGLLNGGLKKSADVVGRVMELNPHGDAAIYETMVRMSRGNETLLHPFVESKGNFGKAYSRDMAYAASRYTEVKLAPICKFLFQDIDKDAVDFVPNYSGSTKEPVLLPARFPTVLVNSNLGVAVGMATNICPFNLEEVCRATIGLLKNEAYDPLRILKAPDFPGGGFLLYDEAAMRKILRTGRGSFKVRSRYVYDKEAGCIEITEIPPTTTIEAILDKIAELVRQGKVSELKDLRDESDISGLKIALELKRGADPDKLMHKLFRMTPLEDSFACNFNLLIEGSPRVMGVKEILQEWIAWRTECVRRRVFNDLGLMKDKLHLLEGLSKILLDIDKAIHIIRETEEESLVVPNLMIGFGIDKIQADYVAEIKLRHLNREFILSRTAALSDLRASIADYEDLVNSHERLAALLIDELQEVIDTCAQPRRTVLLYDTELEEDDIEEEEINDDPVHFFFSKEGYFKKITPASWRMSNHHKLKEDDEIIWHAEGTNADDLLFFTDFGNVYKIRAREIEETKASVLGDFIPAQMGFEEGEKPVFTVNTRNYEGFVLFFYANGKVAKTPLDAYQTKTNRRKLSSASSTKSPLITGFASQEELDFTVSSNAGRLLIVSSAAVPLKSTKGSQGVAVLSLRKGQSLVSAGIYLPGTVENDHRHRAKSLPAAGKVPTYSESQISLLGADE